MPYTTACGYNSRLTLFLSPYASEIHSLSADENNCIRTAEICTRCGLPRSCIAITK